MGNPKQLCTTQSNFQSSNTLLSQLEVTIHSSVISYAANEVLNTNTYSLQAHDVGNSQGQGVN
jgi:hypothetical protein